ncbi:MAG: hypothetical protein AAF555_03565 [Verrucomicrobiota bacterium]
MRWFSLSAWTLWGGASASFALELADYDLNGNGQLDAGREAEVYALHEASEVHRLHDANFNGQLDVSELAALQKRAETKAAAKVQQIAASQGLPVGPKAIPEPAEGSPSRYQPLGEVALRRSINQISLLDSFDGTPAGLKKAQAASLAYSQNGESEDSNLVAKGALIFHRVHELAEAERSDPWTLTRRADQWSVSFDIVSDESSPEDDVESVIFRFGQEIELIGGPLPIRYQLLRASLGYATDLNLEGQVPTLELEWEPTKRAWGIGEFAPLPFLSRSLDYRARFIGRISTGKAFEAGDFELEDNEFFGRIGPKISLELVPSEEWVTDLPLWWSWIERTKATASYQYLYGFAGEPEFAELLEVNASMALNDFEQLTLEVGYRRGQTDLLSDEVDLFTIGLGLKF